MNDYERGWNDAIKRVADWIAWTARAAGQEQRIWVAKLIESVGAMRFKDSECSSPSKSSES